MGIGRIDENPPMPIDILERLGHVHPIRGEDDDIAFGRLRLGTSRCARAEIGDQPIFKAGAAGDLKLVFKEVADPPRKIKLPVQFLYSNAVHGAEGPINKPHS